MNNVVYLKLNENNFYEAYNDDAFVVAYIMKYKLVSFGKGQVKIGFSDDLLNEVIRFLKKIFQLIELIIHILKNIVVHFQ